MIWRARFEPRAVIAALPRATMFMGVPTVYVRRLAAPSLTRDAQVRQTPSPRVRFARYLKESY